MMKHYASIDLHGTNSVIVVLGEDDRVVHQELLRNELKDETKGSGALLSKIICPSVSSPRELCV